MKPYLFIDKQVPSEVEAYLAEHCTIGKWDDNSPRTRQELFKKLENAQGLLTSGTKIDQELLEHAPMLKAVSTVSVGYNHFDVEAMKRNGVLGTNTPYVLDETVADLVLAMMLGSARRITELDQYVKEGSWQQPGDNEKLFGTDVHHATIGIIGMGRIGEAIARRAKFGFSMEVLYYNRSRKPSAEEQFGAGYRPLEELLAAADFIVLMAPLTEETRQMIGAHEFGLMKRSATFINASRGQLVDETALISALQQGTIRAAALDVYDREPVDPGNPLLRMPNVMALPHIGSATAATRFDMAMLAAKNLVQALTGQTPPNIVPELLG